MKICFTLAVTPRTKKTSNKIIRVGRFHKIMPSDAYLEFFKAAMVHAPVIRRALEKGGAMLPITGPVSVKALFYRDAERGDLLGYEQALADWLQEPKWSKKNVGKMVRNGAGMIVDDVQIQSWDGSRPLKDAARPRIEVEIEEMAERAPTLFDSALLVGAV